MGKYEQTTERMLVFTRRLVEARRRVSKEQNLRQVAKSLDM
jgi:hypothetical protein